MASTLCHHLETESVLDHVRELLLRQAAVLSGVHQGEDVLGRGVEEVCGRASSEQASRGGPFWERPRAGSGLWRGEGGGCARYDCSDAMVARRSGVRAVSRTTQVLEREGGVGHLSPPRRGQG